ncbi:MAG: hypothetical protein ABSH27_13375 [Solirubrobacteraceae bacterium]|jgi:hypothetical protein
MSTFERLRELIAAEGPPLASGLLARVPVSFAPSLGALAAAGPRASGDPGEYELLIEAIYEGYLLHYGESRLFSDADADLSLLAGDRLYTVGLERLVALGDLDAVLELADVIALCALLVGRDERASCDPLWRAGAHAVGWGAPESYRQAKALARSGDDGAGAALRALADPPALA